MKDSQKQRIEELERVQADALLKVKAYEQGIGLTEQEKEITILKKMASPSSGDASAGRG